MAYLSEVIDKKSKIIDDDIGSDLSNDDIILCQSEMVEEDISVDQFEIVEEDSSSEQYDVVNEDISLDQSEMVEEDISVDQFEDISVDKFETVDKKSNKIVEEDGSSEQYDVINEDISLDQSEMVEDDISLEQYEISDEDISVDKFETVDTNKSKSKPALGKSKKTNKKPKIIDDADLNESNETKFCNQCEKTKSIEEFNWLKKALGKREAACGECRREYKRARKKEAYKKQLERRYTYGKTKICINPDCPHKEEEQPIKNFIRRSKITGQREARCKECIWGKKNTEGHRQNQQDWYSEKGGRAICQARNERYKPIRNARNRERRKTDIHYRLKCCIRNRMSYALKASGLTRKGKIKFIGMDMPTYKIWLGYQFEKGMTWDNYGTYWHVDHVMPCDSFNFVGENDDDVNKCFNWKNTRPMVGIENIKKGSTIDEVAIKNQKKIVKKFYCGIQY